MTDRERLHVAIVGSNNNNNYSGGRYHAMIFAYILARAGADVTMITNTKPIFANDLEVLAHGQVNYEISHNFQTEVSPGKYDVVIVVPTGVFQPAFYEAAMCIARGAKAPLMLLNFESANWFNAFAPAPRDVRLWDYWRRLVAEGGVILSSARESDRLAREFYRSWPGCSLRFEVCSPPINSLAADLAMDIPKDGSVLAFVRAADIHKGGGDLLTIPPEILAGRTLRIVAGGGVDPKFHAALQEHFGGGSDVEITIHSAVSDMEKFTLIRAAQAVVFPSRFEGFGYPPVEAAYVGTECVCYDLPVLRETVGSVAHFAPCFDTEALGAALQRALAMPERTEMLRAAVADRVDVDAASMRLTDILLRSLDTVSPPHSLGRQLGFWGPFPEDTPDASVSNTAPLPPRLVRAAQTDAGDVLISMMVCTEEPVTAVVGEDESLPITDVHLRLRDLRDGWYLTQITGLMPLQAIGSLLAFRISRGEGLEESIRLNLREAERSLEGAPAVVLEAARRRADGQGIDLALQLKQAGMHDLAVSTDGESWVEALTDVSGRAFLTIPESPAPDMTLLVYTGDRPVAVHGGFPPFTELRRRRTTTESETGGSALNLSLIEKTDTHWQVGVLRTLRGGDLSSIICDAQSASHLPVAGDIIRLASGQMRRLVAVERRGNALRLSIMRPVNPAFDGAPGYVTIVSPCSTAGNGPDPDLTWRGGIWRGDGASSGRIALVRSQALGRLAHSGPLALTETAGCTQYEILDIRKMGSRSLVYLAIPLPETLTIADLRVIPSSRANGLAEAEPSRASGDEAAYRIHLPAHANIGPDAAIVFPHSGLRRVLMAETTVGQDGAPRRELRLEMSIDIERDLGHPIMPRLALPEEILTTGEGNLLWPSPVDSTKTGTLQRVLDEFRAEGTGLLTLPPVRDDSRPRVLFASLVPPIPQDQGNRIVTRNFIRHLLNQGFDVDLLLVGDLPPAALQAQFGNRVRLFSWPYPEWQSAPIAELKRRFVSELNAARAAGVPESELEKLRIDASAYHPYFIVPDGLVRLARALYRTVEYHSIVCNYTHMIRVPLELAPIRKLPPVAVVTHDALSRLPFFFHEHVFDTGHRYCLPETESAVLDAVKDAVVLAISESEQSYFAGIGVKNPILLCEYDGVSEGRRYQISSATFRERRMIFHASNNPMNTASLRWFLERCWPMIRAVVPDAQVAVCGGVCKSVEDPGPGVILCGVIPREDMMYELTRASVAINPTVAGTGLKIKTVEAASCGLPSVCTPAAVEGLEEVASEFCILARTPAEYAEGCVRLLTDESAWQDLHFSTLRFAAERFSEQTIYSGVDRLMGWDQDVDARFARPRKAYRTHFAPVDPGDLSVEMQRRIQIIDELQSMGSTPDLLWAVAGPAFSRLPASRSDLLASMARLGLDTQLVGAELLETLSRLLAERPSDPQLLMLLFCCSQRLGHPKLIQDARYLYDGAAPGWLADVGPASDNWSKTVLIALRSGKSFGVPIGRDFLLADWLRNNPAAGTGWANPEDWGIWTLQDHSGLAFQTGQPSQPFELALELRTLPLESLGDQKLRIFINGSHVGVFDIPRNNNTVWIKTPTMPSDEQGQLEVDFYCNDLTIARGPDGALLDRRTLGIAVQYMRISPSV